MIRRNTWILLILLVALVGAVFYINRQKSAATASATPTPGTTYVFTSQEGLPSDIKIEDAAGNSVEVARDSSGKWVLKAPTEAPADQGQAEAAASQITALQIVGDIQIGLDVVGLDKPSNTITITFTGGKTHKLTVGSVTPIQSGYYAQLDGGKVQVVDKQGLDSLLNLLTSPPYVATATPSITDTPTLQPNLSTPTPTTIGSTRTEAPSPTTTTPSSATQPASTATP